MSPFQSAMANLTLSFANMSRELRGMEPMRSDVAELDNRLKEIPVQSIAATDPEIEGIYSRMVSLDAAISMMDRVNLADTDLVDVIDTLTSLQSDLVNSEAHSDSPSLQMADSFLSLATMSLASGFDAINTDIEGSPAELLSLLQATDAAAAALQSQITPDLPTDAEIFYQQNPGQSIVIEAENFHSIAAGTGFMEDVEWEVGTEEGETVLHTQNHGGANSWDHEDAWGQRADYTVNFEEAGTYYVWVRQHGAGNLDNSVHVGLNGEVASYGGQGIGTFNETSGFEWSNNIVTTSQRVTIEVTEAGEHTFNMWVREDGTAIDKIMLTQDESFTPVGGDYQEAQVRTRGDSYLELIMHDLDLMRDKLSGITTDDDLQALTNETFIRWQNIMGYVEDAGPDDAPVAALRDDVQSAIDSMDPYSVHLKLRSAKVIALNLAQIQVREAMELILDPVQDAENYGKIKALDLDFNRPLSRIRLDYDKGGSE